MLARTYSTIGSEIKKGVKKVAESFKETGSVGKEFTTTGSVGGTAQKVGGPFAADGAIGKEFTTHGKIGGTAQKTAEKVQSKSGSKIDKAINEMEKKSP